MLPQLDIATYSSQIFWLIISFVILMIFVGKVFLPRITQQITSRQENIQSILDEARKLHTETLQLTRTYNQQIQAQHAQNRKLSQELHNKIKIEKETLKDELKSQYDKKLQDSQEELQFLLDKTLLDYQKNMIPSLNSIIEKITPQHKVSTPILSKIIAKEYESLPPTLTISEKK